MRSAEKLRASRNESKLSFREKIKRFCALCSARQAYIRDIVTFHPCYERDKKYFSITFDHLLTLISVVFQYFFNKKV